MSCLTVSPAGTYLFGGTEDGKLIRWNIETREQNIIYAANSAIYSIAMNSTGSRIAFGDQNGTLRIIDVRTNDLQQSISAHSARITDVEFSPDDQQIATASTDRSLKIWNANNTADQPIVINKHNASVLSLAFSPDGRYLVSTSTDTGNKNLSMIYYWPTHASYMAEQMCGKISRNMTQREWETYVGYDIDYQRTCPNK